MSNENPNITTVLAQVASDVAGELEMDKLLSKILKTAMDTLHAEVCSIYLREGDILKCVAGEGFAEDIKGKEYQLGEGLTGRIGQMGEVYSIKNSEQRNELARRGILQGKYDAIQWSTEKNRSFRNLLALPLKIGSAILGVIKFENKKVGYGESHFTKDDETIFAIIANMLALAIENAKTHRKAEEQSKTISQALADIADSVVGSFRQQDLLDRIVETTMKTLNAEVCSIFLRKPNDPETIICVAASGFAVPLKNVAEYRKNSGFTWHVFETGKEYNILDKKQRSALQETGVWKRKYDCLQWVSEGQDYFRNLLALPLKIKRDTLGVIKAENKKDAPSFSNEDLVIFKTIANVIALAIENARLYEQLETQLFKTASAKAAHKINNQVASYDYVLAVLREESAKWWLPNRAKLKKLADRIYENTVGLKKMTDDFKRFGKPLLLDKKNNNVNEVLKEEVQTAKVGSPELRIDLNIDSKIPSFKFDKGLFAENIREMLRNAKRAVANSKGQIWVSSELIDKEARKFAKITIEDDGQGIDKDFPLFTPYHSSRSDGTGLGLATVKDSIEAHNGKIMLIREGKKGACFEIELPIEV